MRSFAWLTVTALFACTTAPRAPSKPLVAAPVGPSAGALVIAPPASDMLCHDTRDAAGNVVMSGCEVTRVIEADIETLLARTDHHLSLAFRPVATQTDFETVASVPFIRTLTVYSDHVTRLDVLTALPHLASLGISVPAVPSLPALRALSIEALTISGIGRIADLTPLAGFDRLVTLSIGGSNQLALARLAGIEALPALQTFSAFAVIEDGSALARARAKNVSLHNGRMPLESIAHLALDYLALNLNVASDEDLDAFEQMPTLATLKTLDISTRRVPTLPAMPALEVLRVGMFSSSGRLARADLSFALVAPRLRSFAFGGVEGADLTPLLRLRALEHVDVAGVCVVDATNLARLPRLAHLVVSQQPDNVRPQRAGLAVHEANPFGMCTPLPAKDGGASYL